ncbi:hypothetical protein [Citrobacter sedlakii]
MTQRKNTFIRKSNAKTWVKLVYFK